MEIMINTLTPEVFLELYRSVGWEPPCIEQVSQALKNTIMKEKGNTKKTGFDGVLL